MASSVQAFGIGLVTFFSVFLPGVVFLWLASALWLPSVGFLDLASLVGKYGLKSEWWMLAVLLFFGYIAGSVLDIIGAKVLDACYEKIINRKVEWARRFVDDEEKGKYTPLKSAAHERIRKVYGFEDDAIQRISTFSLCHSAVRAADPQAAAEVDLILSQSKFFRAAVVALVLILLLTPVLVTEEVRVRLSIAPVTLQWVQEGFRLGSVIALLPVLGVVCFWRFVKLRLKSTRVCYEYFVVLATQGQFEFQEPRVGK